MTQAGSADPIVERLVTELMRAVQCAMQMQMQGGMMQGGMQGGFAPQLPPLGMNAFGGMPVGYGSHTGQLPMQAPWGRSSFPRVVGYGMGGEALAQRPAGVSAGRFDMSFLQAQLHAVVTKPAPTPPPSSTPPSATPPSTTPPSTTPPSTTPPITKPSPTTPPSTTPPSSSPPSSPIPDAPSSPSSPSSGSGQMWDVFFDRKEGTKTVQRSPIVLDLNANGRPDITGSNITGNGKIEGKTVNGFDLDPSARQWSTKSVMRRPGSGAPALPAGATMKVFGPNGELVSEGPVPTGKNKKKDYGVEKNQRAEFWDKDGRLVGELKNDEKSGKRMYFWGNANKNEWTKPWEDGKGDGILAWDRDGDGKITGGKELFGEVDVDGKRTFKNGYEKLGKYFDKDGDGVVQGTELQGLKIWEDRDGDGVTDDGELVDLASRGVRSLNTRFDQATMGSTYGKD